MTDDDESTNMKCDNGKRSPSHLGGALLSPSPLVTFNIAAGNYSPKAREYGWDVNMHE